MVNHFDLGLGQQGDLNIEPSYRLDPGYESHLRVYPLVHSTTSDALELKEETRKCRGPEESHGNTFHHYSQGNCRLECYLDQIYSEMRDPCLPWDIPRTVNSRAARVCSGPEAKAFSTLSKNSTCSHCVPSCSAILYEAKIDTTVANAAEKCLNKGLFKSIMDEEDVLIYQMEHSFEARYLQGDTLPLKYCRNKFDKDLHVLELFVETSGILHLETKVASALTDQIGLIGKKA